MKKRTLLMSAAVIGCTGLSIINANAAEKLPDLEGVIEEMHIFNGGKYVYEGYKDENQNIGAYYFNGSEDIEIEDAVSGSLYGTKYVNFADDDILFNIETGAEEEESLEDKEELMEIKFKQSVIKKAERYESTQTLELIGKLDKKSPGKEWYEYKVTNDAGSKSYTVFLAEDGQYIDSSNLYNIVHYPKDENGEYVTEENGKIKKVEITKASHLKEKGYKISEAQTLFSDEEYIYRLIRIASTTNEYDTNTYVQRVSKAQGKQNKGAFMPQSTASFELGENYEIENLLLTDNVQIKSGTDCLYMIIPEGERISVKKLELKKVKEKGSKLDKKVVELDEDFDEVKNESMKDFAMDANENLWILAKGEILKFVDYQDLEVIYTVDRSMERISVYNDGNLGVWNTDNEIYAVIGTSVEDEEAVEGKDEISEGTFSGWSKNENGEWSFIKENNEKAIGWLKDSDKWYYLNNEGIMQTGWVNTNNTWYYMNESGRMVTGWFKDSNEKWYYLNADGSMACDTYVDGYYVGKDGAWVKETL